MLYRTMYFTDSGTEHNMLFIIIIITLNYEPLDSNIVPLKNCS